MRVSESTRLTVETVKPGLSVTQTYQHCRLHPLGIHASSPFLHASSPEKISRARVTNRINHRLILTTYDGVCHECTLDDGFLVVLSTEGGVSDDVRKWDDDEQNEPNRTDERSSQP